MTENVSLAADGQFGKAGLEWRTGQDLRESKQYKGVYILEGQDIAQAQVYKEKIKKIIGKDDEKSILLYMAAIHSMSGKKENAQMEDSDAFFKKLESGELSPKEILTSLIMYEVLQKNNKEVGNSYETKLQTNSGIFFEDGAQKNFEGDLFLRYKSNGDAVTNDIERLVKLADEPGHDNPAKRALDGVEMLVGMGLGSLATKFFLKPLTSELGKVGAEILETFFSKTAKNIKSENLFKFGNNDLVLGLNQDGMLRKFKEYGGKGYGNFKSEYEYFSGQIDDAMTQAEKIRFNLEKIDLSKINKSSGKLNSFKEPVNGHTNYELYQIMTNKAYFNKTIFYKNNKVYSSLKVIDQIQGF